MRHCAAWMEVSRVDPRRMPAIAPERNGRMRQMYLSGTASKGRIRGAARARQNRAEIVRELSWGRVSRRDLIKWGLFTGAGLLAPIGGLNPLVSSARADDSGIPRS